MKTASLAALLTLTLLAASVEIIPAAGSGMFKTVQGSVFILRGENTLPATPGMEISSGDVVRTAAKSNAGLSFTDGTCLSLGEKSELRIKEYLYAPREDQCAFDVFIQQGTLAYSSGKLGKAHPEKVHIATPQTTVGVRGTTFVIKVD